MITLTDTYRHLDGTPGTGHVLVRTVTPFHDSKGTVLGEWVAYPLAADGSVTIAIDADLEHADPGPQWLQIMEQVDCQRGGVWEIGTDVLFASPDPTITLGAVRQLPAITGQGPRYIPVPGPQGVAGPTGPVGPPGPLQIDDLVHAAPEDYRDASGYNEGAVVLFQGAYWVAKKDTQAGQSPVTNAGAWLSLDLDDIARKAQNAAAHGLPSGGTPGQGIVKTGPQPDDVTWAYLLPPVSGHAAGDALTIADPATGQMDWAAVPRLARTPNPATGDLGLPGFAGSDTGSADVIACCRTAGLAPSD